MGREIEMKVPVTNGQFKELYKVFTAQKENNLICVTEKKFVYKTDEYFSKYDSEEERAVNHEPKVIRIRAEKNDSSFEEKLSGTNLMPEDFENYYVSLKNSLVKENAFFTIKYKSIENGIEYNREEETFVQDAEVLREFFKAEKFFKYFSKEKKAFGFICHLTECPEIVFNAELENVNGFTYLEVENTEGVAEPSDVKAMLEGLFVALNLNPLNKDSRSWMKILRDGR